MISEMFTVLDTVAQRYVEPFFAPTLEAALRSFREASETEGHAFQKHSTDYALYHIGSFNAEDGSVAVKEPSRIAKADSFAAHRPQEGPR